MSVYIKGMKMPKPGSYLFTVRYDADGNLCVYPLIYMTGYDDRDLKPETPLLPIVPVPEHGDLIDRDALLENMKKVHDKWKMGGHYTPTSDDEIMVMYMPTIIPASGEGEG